MKSGVKSGGQKNALRGPLKGFYSVLSDIARWANAAKVPIVVVGGVAAVAHGGARPTEDIDLIADLGPRDWDEFIASGRSYGFEARPEHSTRFSQNQSRVLLLFHKPTGVPIDVSVAGSGIELGFFERALRPDDPDFPLRTISPEDLIVMKALAQRDQDARDINAVLDLHPRLNLSRIRAFVATIGEQLDTPELVKWLDQLLSNRRKQR